MKEKNKEKSRGYIMSSRNEENTVIQSRLKQLRTNMKKHNTDWCFIPTGDYHNSEYANDFFAVREYFSGFTGSNGNLLISETFAGLWTDGRYFIQAENELEGTGIQLFRMLDEGVPTVTQYLESNIKKDECLGFDGRIVSATMGSELQSAASSMQAQTNAEYDPTLDIWTSETGRPALPCNQVRKIGIELSGVNFYDKVNQVREDMKKAEADYLFISKLDDLMWLFNIRGNDVTCNPVALSHAFITLDKVTLFIQKKALGKEINEYFKQAKIEVLEYAEVSAYLKKVNLAGSIMMDKKNLSHLFYQILGEKGKIINNDNPTELRKAVKNETEVNRLREVYLKDSVAVTKFIYQIKKEGVSKGMSEYDAAMLMDQIRMQIPECYDLSFPTISGYQANAAMMHYQAEQNTAALLKAEGMLLVDSGGQYEGGTTDVTRTISLGEMDPKQREHYTRVCRGMLNLSNTKFLYGCTGRNLDIVARQPMWEVAMDYKCGTGHGIGYMLNVHEGPQSIRWQYNQQNVEATLEEGMIISNEPGVYLAGEYGIRIENIVLCVKTDKNTDGQFMEFETLTYVPLDANAVIAEGLNSEERKRFNHYQNEVYLKVSPYLTEEEKEWLKQETAAV